MPPNSSGEITALLSGRLITTERWIMLIRILDIWHDFDYNQYRDYVFAYPTMNGVVDTTKWEGF